MNQVVLLIGEVKITHHIYDIIIYRCQNCFDWACFNHLLDAHLEMELKECGKKAACMFQTKPQDVVKLRLEKETSNGWSQGPWLEPCCCILTQLIFALMSGDDIICCDKCTSFPSSTWYAAATAWSMHCVRLFYHPRNYSQSSSFFSFFLNTGVWRELDDSTAHLELIRATAINAFHFFLGVYLYVEGLGSTVPCRGSRVTIFLFLYFF